MVTDTRLRPVPDQFRPMLPDRGPGRFLRRFTGVREELLDWVPEERPRYTLLGFIILNTGVMAGVSLFIALSGIASARWALVVGAVLWSIVIMVLDGWLIASTHGLFERKLRILATRLAISLLMGAFISEPLVLWVFSPAIKGEIVRMQADEAKAERSAWVKCNPSDLTIAIPKGCQNYILNITGSPRALGTQLQNARNERANLKSDIDAINTKIDAKEALARDECNGVRKRGLSGRVGEGPNCRQARRDTDKFRRDSGLAQKQRQLMRANDRITSLTQKLKDSQQGYEKQIKDGIDAQVAIWQAGQNDKGILDQDRALGRLADRSSFVVFMQWLLRLLLITIDISPVLAKAMQRNTAYDTLHRRQVDAGRKLHQDHVDLKVKQETSDYQVVARQTDHDRESRLEQVADADRSARARRQTELDQEVERLAAELRNRS